MLRRSISDWRAQGMQQNPIGARPDRTRAGECLASKWLSRKLLRSKQGRRDERAYMVPATAGDERQRCTPATVPPSARIFEVNGGRLTSAPCVRQSMRYAVPARARTCTRKREPNASSVSGIPGDPSKLGRPPSTPRNWVLPDLYRGEGMQGVGPQAKPENRQTCAPLDVIYIHTNLKNTMYHTFPVHIPSMVKEKLPQNGAPNTGRAYGARRPHGPNG